MLDIKKELIAKKIRLNTDAIVGLAKSITHTMWHDLETDKLCSGLSILHSNDWKKIRELRYEQVLAEGKTSANVIEPEIHNFQRQAEELQSEWFIVSTAKGPAGYFGITPFATPFGYVGRLHDLYLTPDNRGQGLGNELMKLIFELAHKEQLRSLVTDIVDENYLKWFRRWDFQLLSPMD